MLGLIALSHLAVSSDAAKRGRDGNYKDNDGTSVKGGYVRRIVSRHHPDLDLTGVPPWVFDGGVDFALTWVAARDAGIHIDPDLAAENTAAFDFYDTTAGVAGRAADENYERDRAFAGRRATRTTEMPVTRAAARAASTSSSASGTSPSAPSSPSYRFHGAH